MEGLTTRFSAENLLLPFYAFLKNCGEVGVEIKRFCSLFSVTNRCLINWFSSKRFSVPVKSLMHIELGSCILWLVSLISLNISY